MNTQIIPRQLNDRQQLAVKMPVNKPLLIVAGAGSGKTATLTSRFAFLVEQGIAPENIVAITFTNKAASEMKSRLEKSLPGLGIDSRSFIGTFHSFGARLLRREAKLVGRKPNFTIFDSSDSSRLLRRLLKKMNIDQKQHGYSFFSGKISELKNSLSDPAPLLTSASLSDRLAGAVFSEYESELIANNGFDFDDLITKVVRVFELFPDTLLKYQRQYTHLLVDEYQDINRAQYSLIKFLTGDRGGLSVVGDDNQAIYGFRGADYRNFLNFERDFSSAGVVVLEENYRSTKSIIAAASALISHNKNQRPKQLWTNNASGDPVKISEHEDEETEAGWVASAAPALLRQEESVAVIYRTNAQSRALEQAFIENGLAYQIFGGLKFYERKEIKDLISTLAFAFNSSDSVSFDRIMENFYKQSARELIASLPGKASVLPPAELLTYVIKVSGYLDRLAKNSSNFQERAENISELISFAGGFSDLESFLQAVSLFQSSDAPERGRARREGIKGVINLMTIHLSKGLEFDNVFVVGCSEGLLPHRMSLSDRDGIEEERRLMYVAMTRARRRLSVSFFGLPSRYLSEIPTEFLQLENCAAFDDEERYISI